MARFNLFAFAFVLFLYPLAPIKAQDIDFDSLAIGVNSTPEQSQHFLEELLGKQDSITSLQSVKLHLLLAQSHFNLNQIQSSMRYTQRALDLSQEIAQHSTTAQAQFLMGSNFFMTNDFQMAIHYFELSLQYFMQSNNEKMLANNYAALARSYSSLDYNEIALSHYLKSIRQVLINEKWNKQVGVYSGISEPYLWVDDASNYIKQLNEISQQPRPNNASSLIKHSPIWQFFTIFLFFSVILLIVFHIKSKIIIKEQATKLAQQKQHIHTIGIIGREVTSSLELNVVAEYVYSHIYELFAADVFSIGIYNKNKALIDFPFTIEKGKALNDYQINMSDTERLAVWCIQNKKEVVLSQLSDSNKYVNTQQIAAVGGMMQSIVYIPLMVENNIVGCITVQREQIGSFDDFQLSMMQTIASYTAIAVDNALTHEALKEASHTDFLTNLRNRRAFVEKAEYQLNVMTRGKHQLCFAIADIDNFKKINDTYGHECGDFVLKQVADLCVKQIRKQDIIARWGGEEFVFMIPNTDLESTKFLLDKIRAVIADHDFEFNDYRFKITLTFGVTQAVPSTSLTALINVADEALYLGKLNGKNIVISKEYEAKN